MTIHDKLSASMRSEYPHSDSRQEDNKANHSRNTVQVKEEETIEEYAEKFIENRKKYYANDNSVVHKGLVAASEWRKKHSGRTDWSEELKNKS